MDTNRSETFKQNVCGTRIYTYTSNDDGLTDSTPSCISHNNGTVDSVAGGGNAIVPLPSSYSLLTIGMPILVCQSDRCIEKVM